ncbi:MAG: hypothetical protein ACOYOP_16755, partial [Microthrixaceae bacterium]
MSVPLALPEGTTAPEGLAVSASGPSTATPGSTAGYEVAVADVGSTPTSGPITVVVGGGNGTAASGAGWMCAATTCTYAAPVQPLSRTAPLTVTTVAPPTGDSTLVFSATGALAAPDGGPAVAARADATRTLTARTPSASQVSVRVSLAEQSVSPPSRQKVTVTVTGSATGPVTDPVTVRLDAPGLDVDWDGSSSAPWRCSTRSRSCTSTSPLGPNDPTALPLWVSVPAGHAPGLVDLEASAEVAGSTDRARATLVVNRPPVPELRATLQGGTPGAPGAAVTVVPNAPGQLSVVVTNHGSRPAPAGSVVTVTARTDTKVDLRSAGGRSGAVDWDCGSADEVSDRSALTCRATLTEPIASDAAITLPITTAPAASGSWTWTVDTSLRTASGASAGGRGDTDRTFLVEVAEDWPQLVASAPTPPRLVRGLTREVTVTVRNRGPAAAQGAVVVVTLPAGVRTNGTVGGAWACAPADTAGTTSSFACTTSATVTPGGAAPPLVLPLLATTRSSKVDVGLWATTGGQPRAAGPGSRPTTVALRVDAPPRMSAGRNLTVVTPVAGADGVLRPAVVVLRGEAAPSLAGVLQWSQVCGSGPCPRVTWLGVPAGRTPTSAVARFTAPDVDAPTTLTFRLRAGSGRAAASSTVEV